MPCFLVLMLASFLFLPGYTQDESSFLIWAQEYAGDCKQSNSWVCGLLPSSSTSGLSWWVSPLQGDDWNQLQQYINQARASSPIAYQATRWDVSQWPIHSTRDQKGQGKHFSREETDKALWKYVNPFLSNTPGPTEKENNHRYQDGLFQVWDTSMWVTSTKGHLSQVAPLCWEQQNHTRSDSPRDVRYLGWVTPDLCQNVITLNPSDWFATEWDERPRIRWAAPNGTQWLCGTNLWPWLPPGWIGRCTLGFPWM